MDKADLGLKFTCVSCAARSFDLKRSPAICPKCSAEQPVVRRRPTPGARAPSRAWSANKHPVAVQRDPEAAEAVVDDEVEEEAPDDDADTIDPDVLDDDDDVEVIVPHVED